MTYFPYPALSKQNLNCISYTSNVNISWGAQGDQGSHIITSINVK